MQADLFTGHKYSQTMKQPFKIPGIVVLLLLVLSYIKIPYLEITTITTWGKHVKVSISDLLYFMSEYVVGIILLVIVYKLNRNTVWICCIITLTVRVIDEFYDPVSLNIWSYLITLTVLFLTSYVLLKEKNEH